MKTSTIIVTYNRPKDLEKCLESILTQSSLPDEIIIVDNGDSEESRNLINKKKEEFKKKDIPVKYIKNDKRNSLTVARNLGLKLSIGKIVVFLEDDITLNGAYLSEVIRVYKEYPEALGVQGYYASEENWCFRDFIHRLFFWFHLKRDKCQIFPSISTTYPLKLNKIIPCQWMSGVSSYRRQVFREFQFDEKLIKYSDGEDVDFSFRVYQKYPGSLFITPFAKYMHQTSAEGRALGKELIYMREVYGLYLFYKLFKPTLKNKLIYFWSRFGRFLLTLARAIIKHPPGILAELRYLLGAYFFCLFHIKEIKRGELEFFNRRLVNN